MHTAMNASEAALNVSLTRPLEGAAFTPAVFVFTPLRVAPRWRFNAKLTRRAEEDGHRIALPRGGVQVTPAADEVDALPVASMGALPDELLQHIFKQACNVLDPRLVRQIVTVLL